VVTGASRGIGRAIAGRMVEDGCDCFLVARSADGLKRAASEIAAHGTSVGWHSADLGTIEGCTSAAEAALKRFGRVDILVNCAGATKAGAFPDQPDEEWISGFALKFHGAVRLTRLLWKSLAERKGWVVNIGGAAAFAPSNTFMVGGAVNAALAHFTSSLSRQGLIDDVNVSIVHPGATATDRMEQLLEQQATASGRTLDEVKQSRIDSAGTRRLGQPDDIANAVAFLCSPSSRHVHGVSLTVDGGETTGFH